ncbi:hypothetical protein J3Q64DRAFT_1867844 [Phycomyces blakesleeanus]
MRSHMEHHPGIKNVEEWKFVSQNLDKIAEAAIGSIVKDIAKEYSYANPPNKQPLQNGSPSYYSMVTSTYYTRCLSALVNMTISELRTSDFFFDNNDIKIKKVHGFNLSEFLPFVTATEPKHTTQPLDKNLIGSKRFDTDFKCLFTSQNLQVINDTPVYLEDVKHQSPEASTVKQSVCSLICNMLKKFLPPKKQYRVIAYQIYFCIFTNDVLKYARHTTFTRALCPSTTFS